MRPDQFADQFLTPNNSGPLVGEWAQAEAGDLPPAVLDALDPFILRDRITWYEHHHAPTSSALLRAVLDRTIAWQVDHALPTHPSPEQEGGGRR
jgi:hypothetical protein